MSWLKTQVNVKGEAPLKHLAQASNTSLLGILAALTNQGERP